MDKITFSLKLVNVGDRWVFMPRLPCLSRAYIIVHSNYYVSYINTKYPTTRYDIINTKLNLKKGRKYKKKNTRELGFYHTEKENNFNKLLFIPIS